MESTFRIRRSEDHLYDLEKLEPRKKTHNFSFLPSAYGH